MDRLKQIISTAIVDEDPEETKRRKGLAEYVRKPMAVVTAPDDRCRTFKQIEELSQKMLAKRAITRFADKGEDSKVVAKLIERLREAIVFYQVGNYHLSAPSTVDGNRSRNNKKSTVKSLISR